MREVEVDEKRLSDYRAIIGPKALSEIRTLARKLRGKRVAHVNATPYGGGVAELLHSVVSLQRNIGLDARWFVLSGTQTFFDVTKTLHNALQGADVDVTPDMQATYRRTNEVNADEFRDEYDFVVIHDPQPAPLVSLMDHRGMWIWRCHIDMTSPNDAALATIAPYVGEYDACIFSAKAYIPRGVSVREAFIVPPAIDPISPKNCHVHAKERESILSRFDFDSDRPMMTQVGRYDSWKDPLGVIDAYRWVKQEIPKVQLLLIGSMARDDPEGQLWFRRTKEHAGDDPDIHLMRDLPAVEVNVLQRVSDVSLAKSLREGFGLIVSESLWKRVPVVGGNVGGIPLQIRNGREGYLVSSVEEAAARTLELFRDGKRRKAMGRAGRERVRKYFLITRHLRDYLRIFRDLSQA